VRTLALIANKITNISPLKHLNKCLINLSLRQNHNLRDITPIKRLKSLEQLDLSCTLIHDFSPLMKLKNLKILNLSYCEVRIKDLYHLLNSINLKKLSIHSFTIPSEQLEKLQKTFPNCKILY
jgi:Leucine-rich repeat (LRR) protein